MVRYNDYNNDNKSTNPNISVADLILDFQTWLGAEVMIKKLYANYNKVVKSQIFCYLCMESLLEF